MLHRAWPIFLFVILFASCMTEKEKDFTPVVPGSENDTTVSIGSIYGSVVSLATRNSYPLEGSCSDKGRPVSLVVPGVGSYELTCDISNGTWSQTVDLSGLSEGQLTITVTHYDINDQAGSDSRIFTLDWTAPTVTSVTASSTSDGRYKAGDSIPVDVYFDEAVYVTGTPTISLNSTGTATYTGGTGTSTLTFNYLIASGEDSTDLDYANTTSLSIDGSIQDIVGNDATLTLAAPGAANSISDDQAIIIDTTAATVTHVTTTKGDSTYGYGESIDITVTFSEDVNVSTTSGTPTLALDSTGTATYTGGTGTSTLTFNYVVALTEASADLDYSATTSLVLNGGAINDIVGNVSTLTLPTPNGAGSISDDKAIVIDTTQPTVVIVTSAEADATYGLATNLDLTVTFSENVDVGGTPTLALDTGATVDYVGGTGTSTLTFTYTVAAGEDSTDLDYSSTSALSLAGGSINSSSYANPAVLTLPAMAPLGSLATTKNLVVDTTTPTITSITSTKTDNTYMAGEEIYMHVHFSENVDVAGGTPTIFLNSTGTATYTNGTGTSTLTFRYIVGSGQDSADLDVYAVGYFSTNGATVRDTALNTADVTLPTPGASGSLSNAKAIVIDTTAPSITTITSSKADGTYISGEAIDLIVTYSEDVNVTGTPTITLDSGGTATHTTGTATDTLIFRYTVTGSEDSADLDYLSTMGTAGVTIVDDVGNSATTALPTKVAGLGTLATLKNIVIDNTPPVVSFVSCDLADGYYKETQTASVQVVFNENVTVAGGTPTLVMNNGPILTYGGGSGTATLTFDYVVGAGEDVADLNYSATNSLALNGATITDDYTNSTAVDPTLPAVAGASSLGGMKDIVIDTITPTVTTVTASSPNGTYGLGDFVEINIVFNEPMTVDTGGGTPWLNLNSNAAAQASYVSGSGTATLTFRYTVLVNHDAADLDYLDEDAFGDGGGTVTDLATNTATRVLVTPGNPGSLSVNSDIVIDTTIPTIDSVTASIAADGTYGAGGSVELWVEFDEVVIVDTTLGTPTLALDSSGTATYTGGTGTASLTFSYNVVDGENSTDLNYSATGSFSLNNAIIRDLGDNDANVTLPAVAGANSLGSNRAIVIDTATPVVSSVTSTLAAGSYTLGQIVPIQVTFDSTVTVAGGVPTLDLDSSGTATYTYGSGTPELTFLYTVSSGQDSIDLDYIDENSLNTNSATITDAGSNATTTATLPTLVGGFGDLAINEAIVIDTTTPTITNVTSTKSDGYYKIAESIDILVVFNEDVDVTGTPTITLDSTGTATYSGGTGTSTLTFNYVVASGEDSADLDYSTTTSLNLAGATIEDPATNSASVTLPTVGGTNSIAGQHAIVIDTTTPTVTSITSVSSNGTYGIGTTVDVSVLYNETVTITSTTATIALNSTGTATYTSGSGTATLTFEYVVASGEAAADLDHSSTTAMLGSFEDLAGNTASITLPATAGADSIAGQKDIVIDTTVPTVVTVTSTKADATYGYGEVIELWVTFSTDVTMTSSTATLALDSGGNAICTTSTASDALPFKYTVGLGETSADLDYGAVATALTGTIKNTFGTDIDPTLPAKAPFGTLATAKAIVIDTTQPTVLSATSTTANGYYKEASTISIDVVFDMNIDLTGTATLTLDSGGTATCAAAAATSTLTFTYVVQAGEDSADLDYLATSSLSGSIVSTALSNPAILTLPAKGGGDSLADNKDIVVDTTTATITTVTSTTTDGEYKTDDIIHVLVYYNEAVTVDTTTGTPTLALNSSGTATYTQGTGTATLSFEYTVQEGEDSSDLDFTATDSLSLNGATIVDLATNTASTALMAPGATNSLSDLKDLVIDTTIPTITITSPEPFTYLGTDYYDNMTFQGTCSENNQEVTISGDGFVTSPSCTSGEWEATLNFSLEPPGLVTVHVDHQDTVGNSAIRQTIRVYNLFEVKAGNTHTCAIISDNVKCWGGNSNKQLGNGSSDDYPYPVNTRSLLGSSNEVISLSKGKNHNCVTGTTLGVRCWGDNAYGQLGDGTTTDQGTPVGVTGLSSGSVGKVVTGEDFSCALMNGDTGDGVACWGENTYGQLGDGTTTATDAPVMVSGLEEADGYEITSISAGDYHACVVADGAIKCWGRNQYGQLSKSNAVTYYNSPVDVTNLGTTTTVNQVDLGENHSCALAGGEIRCWGYNQFGQLGNTATTTTYIPQAVIDSSTAATLTDVSYISMGAIHSCAVANNAAKCWGDNGYGRLGDGTTTATTYAVDVYGLDSSSTSSVTYVTAGDEHTCAIVAGSVQCWGGNDFGQLGDTTEYSSTIPIGVATLGGTLISSDTSFACALVDNRARCWGLNSSGQHGNGGTTSTATPSDSEVFLLNYEYSSATFIDAGYRRACSVVRGGAKCWGYNNSGQLGDNSTTTRRTPVNVNGLGEGSGVSKISSGYFHSCAMIYDSDDGHVKCWGSNNNGELGDGTTTQRTTPTSVLLSSGDIATDLAVGGYHSCAIIAGGVKCWGDNTYGQVGIDFSTYTSTSTPVYVTNLGAGSGVTQIASGEYFSCAIVNGSVKCWGRDSTGQLGNGSATTTEQYDPVTVSTISDVTLIAAGVNHACAVYDSGTKIACWGYNGNGELGNNGSTTQYEPVTVANISSGSLITSLTAAISFSCAVVDGDAMCWGLNANGQLGDGTTTATGAPTNVIGL